jgi:hypothetical protein
MHQNTSPRCREKRIDELVAEVIDDLAKLIGRP